MVWLQNGYLCQSRDFDGTREEAVSMCGLSIGIQRDLLMMHDVFESEYLTKLQSCYW